ncbi:hypothetical protein BJD57_gp27 [Gordonia phage Vivi2]|uniref:Uncharacterized protein n=2 Tax=Vividuovirus TaxID=2560251 RepID=A0A142K9S6_9CAUD|nr:hypothetical protein BJD57_gp27 [Gordonia phage Vivi2]AMS02859.1 hypothetical protein SEA_VIVI2_27 [Gordonia phage Vivi2]QDH92665.1 hypothetical protein SEA_CHARMING_25 [Gordonia phage Charming]
MKTPMTGPVAKNLIHGQQAVTTTAAALPSNLLVNGVRVRNGGTTEVVYIGKSGVTTANGYPLAPGESVHVPVDNTNLVFVIAGATGSTISYLGN